MRLGLGEMLVVLVVVLLVFGPNKLPQLGDALGKGLRNFKDAANRDPPAPHEEETPRPLPRAAALTDATIPAGVDAKAGPSRSHG